MLLSERLFIYDTFRKLYRFQNIRKHFREKDRLKEEQKKFKKIEAEVR